MEYLFVYGTLRKKVSHPMAKLLKREATHMGEGYAKGKLFRISWYPAFIPTEFDTHFVKGDIFLLHEDKKETLLKKLDQYEGDEYNRELIEIQTSDKTLKAWVYIYNQPISETNRILSGDFLN